MDDISRAPSGEPKTRARRRRAKGPAEEMQNRMSVEAPEVVPPAEEVAELPPLKQPAELARVLMAVLLVAREPVSKLRLAQVCCCSQQDVVTALEVLQHDLREHGLPIEVSLIDESARLLTLP